MKITQVVRTIKIINIYRIVMNKKIKFIIPILSLVLFFSFALACTGSGSSSSTTKISEDSSEETMEAEVIENVAPEEVIEEGPIEEEKSTEKTPIEVDENILDDGGSTQETYKNEFYENILVSVDIQDILDGKQKLVVYIKNNNKNHTFSGTMRFEALSADNNTLCLDYIFIDDVPPGIETWAILWGKQGLYNSYSTTITEAEFREVASVTNVEYEEVGITGIFVFIYTTATNSSEFQQIVDIYKNDRFKSQKIFELDFFNDRKLALDAFTNADGVGFGMMLPIAVYNYNANIGLDELRLR